MGLRVRGLTHAYAAGRRVLNAIDLDVADGELAFVLGESGSGKSTLLRCVAGLERPSSGTIDLSGHDVGQAPAHKRRVGLLFQETALFPHLDAADNVAFGLRYRGVARRDRRAEALAYLERVGLADRARAAVDELSGGERQRIALARTLAAKPRALLLDEPLSMLDAARRDDLGRQLRAIIDDERVPAVWVTHDASEATRFGDAVYALEAGRLARFRPEVSSAHNAATVRSD